MLVNVKLTQSQDPIAALIAISSGRDPESERIGQGLYLSGHWSFERCVVEEIKEYPDLGDNAWCYGVCDSPEQLLQHMPFLIDSPKKYVVSFVRLDKSDQPAQGGWRWHKWGPYIGTQNQRYEYLADEPEIEMVYTYHVYQVI